VRDDQLLLYYEHELAFLRQMGAEFAEKYPKIASRLNLEPHKSEDPHVERMLEAFAFLAARVHLKIDDEFPEITEALLTILYPHYIRPIPSMSIAEFHTGPDQGKFVIEQGSVLNSRPVGGVPCKFRTCYETTMWPITVVNAAWTTPDRLQPPVKIADAVGAIRLELRCHPEIRFDNLAPDSLRFYLAGESHLVHTLYELMCNNCFQVLVRDPTPNSKTKPVILPGDAVRPVGFAGNEGMLPYPRRSFAGYRLFQEYFSFPQKFFFLDITMLESAFPSGFGEKAELVFLISPFESSERRQALEVGVSARTFRLGCVPIVNLFAQTAEPILLDYTRYEYPVIPDVTRRSATEVFSVDEVTSISPRTQETIHYDPFYSYRHGSRRDKNQTFWHTTRRPSARDDGTDVFVSLVDLSSRPMRPNVDTLMVRVTCTNRDLPARLPFGNDAAGDLDLEGGAPVKRIVVLSKPTNTLRPPVIKESLWRLISHLSLNYLSLVEEGRAALQEILRLYNFTGSPDTAHHIEGLTALNSRRHFARVVSEDGVAFARGTLVEMEFDEDQFAGAGVYLFASVLEHFLGLYVSLNSFSQLAVTTRQRKEVLRKWPPRAGQKILL